MCSATRHVCFTPESGHVRCTSPCLLWANSGHWARLLNHFVGAGKQRRRRCEAERFGGLKVDHQIEFDWALHRQIGRLFALEDAINIAGGALKAAGGIIAIGCAQSFWSPQVFRSAALTATRDHLKFLPTHRIAPVLTEKHL